VFSLPYLASSHSASYQHTSSHLILSQSKLASSKVSFLRSVQGYKNPRREVAQATKFSVLGSGEVSGLANIAQPHEWRGRNDFFSTLKWAEETCTKKKSHPIWASDTLHYYYGVTSTFP